MGIKLLRRNMFCDIALDVTCLHLRNTSSIIFIDNGRMIARVVKFGDK
jgi:hypothetical protein